MENQLKTYSLIMSDLLTGSSSYITMSSNPEDIKRIFKKIDNQTMSLIIYLEIWENGEFVKDYQVSKLSHLEEYFNEMNGD